MPILCPDMVAALKAAYAAAEEWLAHEDHFPIPVPRAVEVARELRNLRYVCSERDAREACAAIGLRLIDGDL